MLKKVDLKSIKGAKWNPKSRTRDIGALTKSIERVGLLQPVLITKAGELVDGHRRVAAAQKLGWDQIHAVVVEGDQAEMFAEVNTQKKQLSSNEVLEVYLVTPTAICAKTRTRLAEMEEVLGRPLMEKMSKSGFSLGTYALAKRIATDAEQETYVLPIVKWLMKYRCAHIVRRALQVGTAPSKLLAAVKNDKPLRISFAA